MKIFKEEREREKEGETHKVYLQNEIKNEAGKIG